MKLILRAVCIYLFTWFIYLVPKNYLSLDSFKIKEINVVGNSKILSNELTELTKKLYNSNIWDIDISKIEGYLRSDVRIEDVHITNPKLGVLNIEISEREPKFYAQIDGKIYVLDEDGNIFGTLKESKKLDTYIIVAKNYEELKLVLELSKKLEDTNLKDWISQIYVKDKDTIELLLPQGEKIRTNLEVETEKYRVVEALYSDLIKSKKINYIDIRFDDYIVNSVEVKNSDK